MLDGLNPMTNQARKALEAARAHIKWLAFGECRADGWEEPPPTAAGAVALIDAALAQQEAPCVEVWHGERKVTVYVGENVLRIWGANTEAEMSDAPYSTKKQQPQPAEQAHDVSAAGEPVAEVCIEPDYWNRGHFYEGQRKTICANRSIEHLPVGTKLYTKDQT